MKTFTCARLPELRFGAGVFGELPALLSQLKFTRIAVVTGGRSFRETPYWTAFLGALGNAGIEAVDFSISHEPDPDFVNESTRAAVAAGSQAVVGIGGGSAIDGGKAVSALAGMGGRIEDYLEGVGTKKPDGRKLPFFAVPTTAGTGSEATKNAVISRTGDGGFKKSLRHVAFVPDVAIVDPELSLHCPADTTAATGLDAVTQLIEAYVSTGANPVTDALAESGLAAARRGFIPSLEGSREGSDAAGGEEAFLEARSQMAYAAYLSGVCLATAGLGIVHGVASPMGARYPVPHGVVCGTLLPGSIRATVDRLKNVDGDATLEKYGAAAVLLGVDEQMQPIERCEAIVDLLERWLDAAQLPGLSKWGIDESGAREIAAATGGKTHPAELDGDDVARLIIDRL